MGWSCEACTYRNLSDSAKSCITCGTVRNKRKQPIVELMATEDENAASSRLVPSERNAAFEKRPASSTQRTLFGGVVDETNKGKPAKKAKPSSKKTSMQSSIEENNDTAYASTEQKQQAPIPATVSHQSTLTQNRSLASYRPMSQDSFQTLKQRARQLLTEVFGIEDLRNQQPKAIKCALKGQSCIVVMATGGGKSLCYQLPALTRGGTTIVISPLIALMKDQVNALVQKGVAAAAICSANTQKENTNVMERMLGRSMSTTTNKKKADEQVFLPLTLVYCTPELLQTQRFQNVMEELHKKNRLSFIAIDEAHCMSSWGHDFRPAYRKLDYVRRAFPQVPCMALTATATANVIADIRQNLLMPESVPCHVGSFDRPNIFYKVRYKDYLDATMDGGSLADMVKFITKHHERAKEKGSPIAGIIYCHKRDDTQFLAKEIEKCTKIPSAGYHGGMKDADRTKIQEEWTSGKVKIVCATISFGMGIDLDCVRYVIHWSIPKSMSGFYQESGRAGRDGVSSVSLVYYSQDDANKFAFLISKNRESKKGQKNDKTASKRDEQALQEVVDFCTTPGCRRQYVLKHFGEKETDPKKVCMKTCDFCSNPERVEKAIQSSVASRAILFQKKQATKTKKAAKWDGQWDRPHDDDGVYNDWGDEEWNVDGLGITSSSTGDDGGAVASGGGFRTAKSMVDWERLEKLESKEMGTQENRPSGFVRFKVTGETSSSGYKARDIYPEHVREAINKRSASLNQGKAPKPKESTAAEHAANAASLQAQLEELRKQQEALLAKKRPGDSASSALPPPSAFTATKPRR